MSKQDRQGARTPAELERKYGLGEFMFDQRKTNQEMSKELNTLDNSLSSYKTENDDNISKLKKNTDDNFKKFNKSILSIAQELSGDIDALSKGIFNMVYPVGAIYLSVSATNPGTLFGGKWVQIKDTFLLASGSTYSAGSTGGEATHTLIDSEMPSHNHKPETYNDSGSVSGYKRNFTTNLALGCGVVDRIQVATSTSSGKYAMTATKNTDISNTANTSKSGGSKAHNNMPPYLAVYVWKRTA